MAVMVYQKFIFFIGAAFMHAWKLPTAVKKLTIQLVVEERNILSPEKWGH